MGPLRGRKARARQVVVSLQLAAAETGGVGLWPAGDDLRSAACQAGKWYRDQRSTLRAGRPRHLGSANAKLTHYPPASRRARLYNKDIGVRIGGAR